MGPNVANICGKPSPLNINCAVAKIVLNRTKTLGWGGRKGERQTTTAYFGQKQFFPKRSASNLNLIFGPENSFQGGIGRPGESKNFQGARYPQLPVPMRQLHVKMLQMFAKLFWQHWDPATLPMA